MARSWRQRRNDATYAYPIWREHTVAGSQNGRPLPVHRRAGRVLISQYVPLARIHYNTRVYREDNRRRAERERERVLLHREWLSAPAPRSRNACTCLPLGWISFVAKPRFCAGGIRPCPLRARKIHAPLKETLRGTDLDGYNVGIFYLQNILLLILI